MKIIQRGRLKFVPLGGSVGIPPGMGSQAHRITVCNKEGGYPNTCENVKAEIVLTFLHIGETHRIAGLFSRTDGQKITSEPAQMISLQMLESSELLLLCRDSVNRAFRTITRWPFQPESETELKFGDWRLEIAVSCDSQDLVGVAFDVRLKPDLSSTWSPIKDVPSESTTARTGTNHPKAFVSRATQDHPFVEKFAADLRGKGVNAWYSGWEIKPGDSIRKKIDEALEDCEFFIIVLSKNSISRPWVQTELDAATVRKLNGKVRKIIPVKIEDCGDLPPTLGSLCWEDFSTRPYVTALKRVLDSIFEVDVKPPLGTKLAAARPNPPQQPSDLGNPMELPSTQFPINMFQVDEFTKKLRSEGFDARTDLFNGQVGVIVGPKGLERRRMPPETAGFFFPLWELNYVPNRPLVEARKFHDLFESRPSDWQFNRPYQKQIDHDRINLRHWNRSASLLGDRKLEEAIQQELMRRFPTNDFPVNIDVIGVQDATYAVVQITDFNSGVEERAKAIPENFLGSGGMTAAVRDTAERMIGELQKAGRLLVGQTTPRAYAMAKLSLRLIAGIGDGPDMSNWKQVTQYEVQGLPPGERAWIANFGAPHRHNWRILRATDEVQSDWTGDYASADEALTVIQKEFVDG